jgi:hypothetical protein
MKSLKIEVILKDDKVATAIHTIGYDDKKIEDQFELLGIMENLKNIINARIKKLAEARGRA